MKATFPFGENFNFCYVVKFIFGSQSFALFTLPPHTHSASHLIAASRLAKALHRPTGADDQDGHPEGHQDGGRGHRQAHGPDDAQLDVSAVFVHCVLPEALHDLVHGHGVVPVADVGSVGRVRVGEAVAAAGHAADGGPRVGDVGVYQEGHVAFCLPVLEHIRKLTKLF